MNHPPILYSFRRCPYAIRARLAIAKAEITVELREVVLRNKPQQLLDISAKGTVPVLQLQDGEIIDESIDIMHWALSYHDPGQWLENASCDDINHLIEWNDGEFKYYLDRYKYADRYPENTEMDYREKAENFLLELEKRLTKYSFLCSESCSLADIAIFPFIRQFSAVNSSWFQSSGYKNLKVWLNQQIDSSLFISVMDKYPAWESGQRALFFT
jgi:glutathione S-transferase